MGKDCPFIHSQKMNRSTITQWKHEGNESKKEKVRVAIVNIANHWPRISSGKLLQFETSMNTHLKAEGNLVQMGRSKMPMRGILALKKQTSIRKEKHQILTSEFEEKQKSRTNFHLWTWSRPAAEREHLQMHRRMIEGLQSGMKSKKSFRGRKHTNFTKASSRQRTRQRCQQNKILQMLRPSKGEENLTGFAIHSKDMVSWSTVALQCIWWDSLLWLIMRRRLFDSEAKFWIFRPPMALWSQTRKQRSTSRRLALIHLHIWWKMLRKCYCWESMGRFYNLLVLSYSWPTRETPSISKGKKSNRMHYRKLRPSGCSY